jgi:signal transduction histidine kinase
MRRPPRNDVLLALALAVPSLVQVLAVPIAPRAVGVIVALGSTLPIAWRRVYPSGAAVAGSLIWIVPTDGYVYLGYAAAFVLFYSLAAHEPDTRRVIAVTAFGLVVTVVTTALRSEVVGELFGALSAVAAPAVAGRVVRRLRELTLHLEQERERAERAAIAEERGRIARELHDVVAHGISVIAIQADAAEAALDRDPELARAPLRTIRRSAKASLEEMRHLLGMLREDGDGGELAPQPGLGELGALIEHAHAAGVDVALEVDGEPRELAPGLDLSAYRIVQEALTNVRRHAGGAPTRVRMVWAQDALTIEIRDRGPGGHVNGSAGHGILGMRERARLHGGELHAGPAADGFTVRARLPL